MADITTDRPYNATSNVDPQEQNSSAGPKNFGQMNAFQQFIMMLLMFFVRTADPDNKSSNKTFASIMGFGDDDKGVSNFRSWREHERKTGWNWQHDGTDLSHVDLERARRFASEATGAKLDNGPHQQAVSSVLNDAARTAGISSEMLAGVWGVESHFGENRLSPSGCVGDFQFTQGTFHDTMAAHGAEIAAALTAQGHPEEAAKIHGGSTSLNLRDDPYIATYAGAFYMKDVANTMHVDANKEENWGRIYAGYNIGPGNAKKLDELAKEPNAGNALGSVARWNPQFFRDGATGAEALQNYQNVVEKFAHGYDRSVSKTAPTETVASNQTTRPTSVAKNEMPAGESKTARPAFDTASAATPATKTPTAAPPKPSQRPDAPAPL